MSLKSMRTDIRERLWEHQMGLLDAYNGRLDVVVCVRKLGWMYRLFGRYKLVGFYRDGEFMGQKPQFKAVDEAAARRLEAAIPEAIVSY